MVRKTRAIVPILALTLVACSGAGGSAATSDSAEGTDTGNTSGATSTSERSQPAATPATTVPATEDPGTDVIAVCPLLTPEEVGTVFDAQDQGEEDATLAPLHSCSWTDSSLRELVLSVAQAPSPAEAEALFGVGLDGSEELTGLGDAARLHPAYFGDGAEIEVISGAFYITLAITEIDDDHDLVPLLEAVLTRIP